MPKNPKRPPMPAIMPHYPRPKYKLPTEDIFSKKETSPTVCPNPEQPIIIDSREKNSMILANLLEKKANVKLEKLDIADYLIGDIAIERKNINDLIGSMKSNRLQEQLENLKQHTTPLLIIESFHTYATHSNIHPNALNGIILSTILHHNIPIIYTDNQIHTAQILIQIAQKNTTTKATNPKKIPKTLEHQQLFILESFPGIGPKTAKQLLEQFQTLKNIFTAKEEELEPILKKNTTKFCEIINYKDFPQQKKS
ncbi:MAG: ERCC4-type nuclease [Patescibacteria group bacterium]|jgi:ERCC4-type nuclease